MLIFNKKICENFNFFKRYNNKNYKNFLKISLIKKSGRSNIGRLILLGRGGGFNRFYRIIDFKRLINNIPARVLCFEFDPNRNIFIMKLLYLNGVLTYSLVPLLVKLNQYLINNDFRFLKNGVSISLSIVIIGSFIHCVKLSNKKSNYARSAGTFIYLLRKIGSYVLLRLPSKEELFIFNQNFCILGRLSGLNVKLVKATKAGFFRNLGYKSKVRGVAKNPIDHPHGGGEGKTTAGQPSVTPWGFYTKGIRTSTRFKRFNLNVWGFFRRRNGVVW